MNNYYKRSSCAICKETDLEKVMDLNPSPISDAFVSAKFADTKQELYPLDLYFCNNCGLLQILDIIDPSILYQDYLYETSSSLGLSSHFKRYADDILSNIQTNGDLFIDIGCNDGTLLKYFQEHGKKVLGVEPAIEISNKLRSRGIPCYNNFFSIEVAKKIRQEYGPASVVTANNVFANIVDLNEFLQGVHCLLDKDGVFVLETGAGLDVIKNLMVDTVLHEHIYYFNVKPLDYLAKQNGLELVDVRAIDSKGGSLHVTMQLQNGPRTISSNVQQRRDYEQKLGFESVEVYKTYTLKLEALRKNLVKMLEDIKGQGQTIAVYGAAAGVTSLLYYFDINEKIDFLIDDNVQRQHLLSPGYHIPVLPTKAVYERKPDYILILAWRYSKPIIEKHQQYISDGGKFIIPLPEIKLVSKAEIQSNPQIWS